MTYKVASTRLKNFHSYLMWQLFPICRCCSPHYSCWRNGQPKIFCKQLSEWRHYNDVIKIYKEEFPAPTLRGQSRQILLQFGSECSVGKDTSLCSAVINSEAAAVRYWNRCWALSRQKQWSGGQSSSGTPLKQWLTSSKVERWSGGVWQRTHATSIASRKLQATYFK